MAHHEPFIKQHISKYRNKDLAKNELTQTLATFKDLRPKLDTYVFSDGTKKDLLCLDGTIPVLYKGNTYNIPLCIWLFETHPYNPPMVYVKPTRDMLIKPSRHVDANGRVYLPYLHEWKHANSDIIGLIHVLSVVFGENSPVYSRPKNQPPPRPPNPAPYPGTQPPPAQVPTSQTPYPMGTPPGGYNQSMPMPTPGGYQQAQGYQHQQYQVPPSSYQAPRGAYPYSASNQYPGTRMPVPNQPMPNQASSYPGYPQHQQSTPYSTPPVSSVAIPQKVDSQQSLSDEQIKMSLQSAVEDKLRRQLKDTFLKFQNEMDALTGTKDRLKQGQGRLEEMISQLEQEQRQVDENTKLLRDKDNEIQKAVSKMEDRGELNIDEIVVPTYPLYKQLLNLVAEEMTIEDTYYYLMEALRKNIIELEVFLKHVRELSRKQYLLRAHIQKVRQTAGLRELGYA